MAPPRQRAAANPDDSRSEASSSTKEQKGPTSKARKPAASTTSGATMTTKDMKVIAAAAAAAATASATQDAGHSEIPGIPWTQMPLSLLHDYRHAYKLSTPSAYSGQYVQMLLSRGIGLRSPTSIAARRAELQSLSRSGVNGAFKDKETAPETETATAAKNGLGGAHAPTWRNAHQTNAHQTNAHQTNAHQTNAHRVENNLEKQHLHHIISQSRVGKEPLAISVRRHFNGAGLVEQEAIAKFLYKVREEQRGRKFRLRFQT